MVIKLSDRPDYINFTYPSLMHVPMSHINLHFAAIAATQIVMKKRCATFTILGIL